MIACGGSHSFVCTDEGEVYSWGDGQYGALGLGTLQDQFKPVKVDIPGDSRIVKVDAGLEHCGMVDMAGRIFVCGNNSKG